MKDKHGELQFCQERKAVIIHRIEEMAHHLISRSFAEQNKQTYVKIVFGFSSRLLKLGLCYG